MLRSCRYPGPSGWEWERNSKVPQFAVFGHGGEGMLHFVSAVTIVFSFFSLIAMC